MSLLFTDFVLWLNAVCKSQGLVRLPLPEAFPGFILCVVGNTWNTCCASFDFVTNKTNNIVKIDFIAQELQILFQENEKTQNNT